MEEIKWTKEQLEVIEDRGNNLLVSASAGSGKTFTMTKRIVDLIVNEKVPISNFLIVTFTKTSAEDMKKKIISKLSECEQTDYVLEQIDAVASSDISDLHSFYSRLVSTYFYEVQLDPNYHIIDELESYYLKDKALEQLFEQKEKLNDKAFFELFDIFSKNRQNTELKHTIINFSNYLSSHINGEKWFIETLNTSYNSNINENECARHINDYVINRINTLAKETDDFAEECLKLGCEKYYNFFIELSSKIRVIKKTNRFLENAKVLFDIQFSTRPTVEKEFKFLSNSAEELNNKIKKEIGNFQKNFISSDEEELVRGINKARVDVQNLYNLTAEFDEVYSKLKRDAGGLDFNDLEKFAYKILQNSEILASVKDKYKYVFVDEYQDINAVQEKIISMISSENNLFCVGDLKQSIYRFRLCDPEIFLQKYKSYSSGQTQSKALKLNANFRSDKKILKFVDRVFSGVMTEKFGELDYAKESKFIAGEENPDEPNSTNICFIDTQKDKNQDVYRNEIYSVKNHEQIEDTESRSIVCEAKYVASKIAQIMESEKETSFSDFAVLVFARNSKSAKFIQELNALGIPVSADDKYDMMSRSYVQEILNFAKLTVVYDDDFLLFKVLKSKLFNFSDNELAEIRLINKRIKFSDVLLEYKNIKNVNLVSKIDNFYNLLKKYKELAGTLEIGEFLKIIYDDFKLFELNLLDCEGEKINDEIDKFISKLPSKGVFEFFIEMGDFSLIHENECGGNAVSLMTVHKSKGIEFKYVFLINTAGRINYDSANGKILFNKNFGVGLDHFDAEKRIEKSTIPISWIRMIEKRKIAEEQQRVLYVALTRAKKKLFVLCSKNSDAISQNFPERPTTYLDWFEPIIFSELAGKHDDTINFESFKLSDFDESRETKLKQLILNPFSEKDEMYVFKYSYENLIEVPLKTSVSKILRTSKEESEDLDDEYESQQDRLGEEYAISSANRGTAYHKVFEKINFYSNISFDKQVEDIIQKLNEEQKNLVSKERILRILKLPFFENISESDKIFKEREFFAKVSSSLLGENYVGGEMILQGVVDLICVKNDEIIILDYKTGHRSSEKMNSYAFQLGVYADAISRAFGKRVTKKLICFIDEQILVEI